MAHFYLPQLTEENLSTPSEFGHWFNNEKKVILGISDAILVDENALTRGVSSIPDIWARPLLFQSAIKQTSRHPLRKRCIQEWRGLMSVLALHKILPDLAAIEIVPITLNSETFSTALKNLSPKPIQLEEGVFYNWNHVLMIKFDGIPLGAFSPSTLVFTGTDYHEKLKKTAFPLKDNLGYLNPPKSKKEGLENVGEWITNLDNQLNKVFYSSQNNPDHQIVSTINYLLDSWILEIKESLGLNISESINATKYKVAEEIIDISKPTGFLGNYNVYKTLLQPLTVEDSSTQAGIDSDVGLFTTRHLKDYKNIIVINEKLLEEDIHLWGETRSRPLGEDSKQIIHKYFNSSYGTKIGVVDIGKDGGMWIRPELYFLSQDLITSKKGQLLTDSESELNINSKYIMPFKREILSFYSPQEIKTLLAPSIKEDNGVVKFTFTLPLLGNKKLKVEKVYRSKNPQDGEGLINEISPPVIEIFPNYLGENWRRYYVLQGNAETYTINPITYSPITENEIHSNNYTTDSTQIVKVFEITGDNAFPEAIEVLNNRSNPLGLILLNAPQQRMGLNDTWTIGIDFGTSNTNVYKKRGDAGLAEPWSYSFPNYLRQVSYSDLEERTALIKEFLFPNEVITLPIPTTLKVYDPSKLRSGHLILDYFLFIPEKSFFRFPDSILSDIKWSEKSGNGSETDSKSKYYLESILFLILVEVASRNVNGVKLVCSYPKAFSAEQIASYKNSWEISYKKLLSPDNKDRVININREKTEDQGVKLHIKEPLFQTEGDAAGEYFASDQTITNPHDRANKSKTAICLDVGGGTTDISIWYEDSIEFDTSVLLAGRQISSLIQTNRRIRDRLFSDSAKKALEEKEKEPGNFAARLNLVLKREENEIIQKLGDYVHDRDIKNLRQMIAFEFGALAYYSAMVCMYTNEVVKKKFKLSEIISSSGMSLHWGGNASKLINWIDFGKYSKEGIASKLLNALFFNGLNNKEIPEMSIKPASINQLQSPQHKAEAAGGLVVMSLESNRRSTQNSVISEYEYHEDNFTNPTDLGMISGENIELFDKDVAFYDTLTNKDLFDNNGSKFKSTSLNRLLHFVDVLNFFGIKNGLFTEDTKILVTDDDKRLINDNVYKAFSTMAPHKEGNRTLEPIFIMEIKFLLEILKTRNF